MNSSPIYKHIISAWQITLNGQKIRRFNFVGSVLDTLILSGTLIYQIGYIWLDIIGEKSVFFTWLLDLIKKIIGNHGTTFFSSLLLLGFLYFLINFLIKNIFNAGLIYLIRAYSKKNEKEYKIMSAFTFWWKKSVKLAEYHSLLFWSKPVYIFYIFFWGYRLLHGNWVIIISAAIIFLFALTITRFLFEYARYYIMLENMGVFESLGKSLTMTLENINVTLRIFVSLILVYLREIILLIGIFLLPFVMSWLIALELAPIFLQGVFLFLGLVYFIFLIIVSAMNAVVELFVEALWFSVFTENITSANSQHAWSHHAQHNHH
jgi:hypothetical protein